MSEMITYFFYKYSTHLYLIMHKSNEYLSRILTETCMEDFNI